MYDLCAPNPLSRSASFSDFYLTGGRFVGNQLRRFVSFLLVLGSIPMVAPDPTIAIRDRS
jgi:hypothetical protein